jgi:uncharacterized phage-like protein YoqJ
MKVMITGHRPNKLGGYEPNPTQNKICTWLDQVVNSGKSRYPDFEVISGMALGVDQWWAQIAINNQVPLNAYVPFEGQDSRWPNTSRSKYRKLLEQAADIKIISPNAGSRWSHAMQIRNEAMVNDADICVAVWNGDTHGGTWNCLQYIRECKKPLCIYHTGTSEVSWENLDS